MSTNDSASTAAARLLVENRRNHQLIGTLPPELNPRNLAEAYAIQRQVVQQLLQIVGGTTIGYKIACTNSSAQALLGMDAPVFGRLISPLVFENGSQLPAADFHIRCVEAEFAFTMGADVPERSTPYDAGSILPLVDAAMPSIEIVDHHFTDWTTVGGLQVAADNAIHGCWIPGSPCAEWCDLDLARQQVQLLVNGQVSTTGSGANVLGQPLNVLAWLANELPQFGLALKAGDRITTGITTDVYLAEAGDQLRADFGPLGEVRVSFV